MTRKSPRPPGTTRASSMVMTDFTKSRELPPQPSPTKSGLREIQGGLPDEERIHETLSEGDGVMDPRVPALDEDEAPQPQSDVARPRRRLIAWLEDFSQKWGAEHLKKLVKRKGRVAHTMSAVPLNMHRIANQTRLVLELTDDFRDGTYREISWRSIALLVTALLYSISPADVVPDAIPFLGQLDDLVLVTVVTRLVDADLRRYCRFKGYEEHEYFRTSGKQ